MSELTGNTATTGLSEQFNLRLEESSLLLPPSTDERILRLAVQAVHCYPTNAEQTKLTRRVMNALVINAQDIYERISDEDKALIRRVRGTPRFTCTVKRILALIGNDGSTNYDIVYQTIEAIFKWVIQWNVMNDDVGQWRDETAAADSGVDSHETAHLLSQWGRGEGRMAGTVSYEFPHDVMMMLLEPARWAQIDLHTVNGMGSGYAIELYHHCARFLGTTHKVTPVLPLDEWIKLIAGQGKYVGRYKDFKRYALQPACEWLEKTDSCPFKVTVLETYGPRKKVVGLQFKLTLKAQASLDMRMPVTWAPGTLDVLRKVYGMTNRDIKELAMAASEAEVCEAMARDRVIVLRKAEAGNPVLDRASYLRGILRNVQSGRPKDAEPKDVDQETPPRNVQDAVAQHERLKREFEQFRRNRLSAMLNDLPGNVVDQLRWDFAAAKGNEVAVSKWLSKGWGNPPPSLVATFVEWFCDTYPEKVQSMLVAPELKEFGVWLAMRSMQDSSR